MVTEPQVRPFALLVWLVLEPKTVRMEETIVGHRAEPWIGWLSREITAERASLGALAPVAGAAPLQTTQWIGSPSLSHFTIVPIR